MVVLAVETSMREGTVAICDGTGAVTAQKLGADGQRHARTLLTDIDSLILERGLRPADIDCVAVSIGPGSFTGLRVGVVFAKTFAWLNKSAVVAVPTLSVVAEQAPMEFDHVFAVSDAQRGELFCGEYRRAEGRCQALGDVRIETPEALRSRVPASAVVTGPGLERYASAITGDFAVGNEDTRSPQAMTVAMIGSRMLREEQTACPWELEPFYLRRSAAEEKRDGAAGN